MLADDLHRGSYESIHVLLSLSNELRKRDKMQFHHFSATSLINSIIQEHKCYILFIMTLNLICNHIFGVKDFVTMYTMLLWTSLRYLF